MILKVLMAACVLNKTITIRWLFDERLEYTLSFYFNVILFFDKVINVFKREGSVYKDIVGNRNSMFFQMLQLTKYSINIQQK